MHLGKFTLVGVGLLGGSLGLAVQRRGLTTQVAGLVRRASAVDECLKLGVATTVTRNVATAVEGADWIVLCSPIGQMKSLMTDLLPFVKPGAIITDVGSVKSTVVEAIEPLAESVGAHFIGSHPMAGSERTGAAASRADLFEGAVCVVTPTSRTPRAVVQRVTEFWSALGSRVISMSPDRHDDLVGRSSHLPHVAAAGLANYVLSPVHPSDQGRLCAGGFRDTTRIASGSPEMWRDIALANRRHLSRVLGVFLEDLTELRRALDEGNAACVEEFFANAKSRRDAWLDQQSQETKGGAD